MADLESTVVYGDLTVSYDMQNKGDVTVDGITRLGTDASTYPVFINGGLTLKDYTNSTLTNGRMYFNTDTWYLRGGGEGELDVSTDTSLAVRYGGSFRTVYHSGNLTTAVINGLNVDASTVNGKTVGTSVPVGALFTDTNTWRGIDDTPVNGQTSDSISSNWAYDHTASSTAHPRDTRSQIAGSYAPTTHTHTYAQLTGTVPTWNQNTTGKANTAGTADDSNALGGLGLNGTTNNTANKVMRTDGNGYANFGWINTISGTAAGTTVRIYCSQDAYLRYYSPAQLAPYILNQGTTKNAHTHDATQITSGTLSDARLPATISSDITGNASTATKLSSILTSFGGTYPVAFNVNGVVFSENDITFNGTTNTLTTPNVSVSGKLNLGSTQQASVEYNSVDNSIDFIIN